MKVFDKFGGTSKRKADEIASGGEEDEVLLVDLTGEEAETPEPFKAVLAASSRMKRPEGQAELERIVAQGMLEGALQTLRSLEAVEQLLRERREEEAARKLNRRSRLLKKRSVDSAKLKQQHGRKVRNCPVLWRRRESLKSLDDDDSSEAFGMGGVGEATFDCMCDSTSDADVVDDIELGVQRQRVFGRVRANP
ncbi:hypothetical protein H310_07675 [Aphanomyces invadans]|uniref:Uncharacterized protein n=1 Tax=Aphanomyces invadans TaxID=157072 RepID=A0A024U336_9STRA|nr:hypothetical protein H310_07675 [Aphanomyces invadans]ETW00302.1 hypothetical protein H310_07675 [Aphanomyces invadans]|eukprot:XP_008871327.1 hypothetical protein H310_07675 [Aphanomyces invadans]